MQVPRFVFGVVTLAIVVATAAPAAEPSAVAPKKALAESYTALVEQARNLAQEGSWERARDLFAEALPAAPNPDTRQWCELWIEDATWRSESSSRRWPGPRRQEEHFARYDAFDKPYTEGRAHDDFWMAALRSRADLETAVRLPIAWFHRAAVANHLAAQPPSAEAARRYVSFLQEVVETAGQHLPREFNLLRPHLVAGARVGGTADERAWCAWQLARIGDYIDASDSTARARLADQAERWTAALAAVPGTRWEPRARAEELIWRVSSGWAPTLPANTPADVPAVIAELQSARRTLKTDASPAGEALRARLTDLERSLNPPRLQVDFGNVFQPGAPVRFSYGASGLGQLNVTLDRLAPADWIALPENVLPPATPPRQIHRPAGAQNVREWTIELPDPARLEWRTKIVEASPALSSGLYLLTIRSRNASSGEPLAWQRKFVVSALRGFAVLSSSTAGKLFAYRADDGSPVTGAAVTGFALKENSSVPWSGNTDGGGAVAVPALDSGSRQVLAVVAGEPVWFTCRGLYGSSAPSFYVDVYTDRPLFRPGESAHWKLVVRERHGDRFTVPTDLADLKFRIMLGDTSLVDPTLLQLNALGTAHGEVRIPEDARAGEAEMELFRGDTPNPRAFLSQTSLFQVDHFVTPAVVAKVELTSGASSLRPGHSITARVTASYFSGGPLVNAPVRFNLAPGADDGWRWSDEVATWFRALGGQPQQGVTDAAGTAEFTFLLPSFLPESIALRLAATVLPEGAPTIDASSSVTVSSAGLSLDPLDWTTARLAHPGENVALAAIVRDGLGSPVSLAGRAQLLELRWSEVWLDHAGRIVPPTEVAAAWLKYGSATRRVPDPWKLVHAGYSEILVTDIPIQTGADGRIDATFSPPHAGLFRLRVVDDQEIPAHVALAYGSRLVFGSRRRDQAHDDKLDARREVFSIVAVDEQTDALALNPETAAVIAPATIDPTQPLHVLGLAPEGATQAWMSVQGDTEIRSERVPLNGRLALRTFDHTPTFLGEGTIEFSHGSSDSSVHGTAYRRLALTKAQHELHVSITPGLGPQRPGQPESVVIATKDSAGRPAAAELAIRVSDEAVNSLVSADASESAPRFGDVARTVQTQTLWSSGEAQSVALIRDPRTGAIRNPDGRVEGDDEVIVLSPFMVDTPEGPYGGYMASNTLAGARLGSSRRSAGVLAPEPEPQSDSPSSELPIEFRRHFASTAFWAPEVVTDSSGEARVTFDYPDNLTRWRIGAYAVGADGNTFGSGNAFTRTTLPFQARLQLPRFLIASDSADPSAVLVNRTDADLSANATLSLAGPVANRDSADLTRNNIIVPKQAEARSAWSIQARAAGEAQLTLAARAGAERDGMVLPLPILEDGLQQHTAAFSRLAADAREVTFLLELPAKLDTARTDVAVQLSPNYAVTLLDALPYLVDYPYGCVEQTMSRFLPAVVVRKTLVDLGLDSQAVERRILAGESPATRLRREKTAGLGRLDNVVRQSLARLEEAQSYSGWGWWPGAPSADLWMTAYVAWGLSLAASAGVEVPEDLLAHSIDSLVNLLSGTEATDDRVAFAWAALSRASDSNEYVKPDVAAKLFARAFANRAQLSATGRACLALAATKFGTPDQAATLRRNLDNGVQHASAAGLGETVHWGAAQGYWRASEGPVEATALTLLALLELDPTSQLVEPAANWLALNRRSAAWASTRDTAFAVLALNGYLQQHGQLDASGEVELLANGTPVRRMRYSRASLLEPPIVIPIPLTILRGGTNTFRLRRVAGMQPVHATAIASSWAPGDDVQPAGHLIDVTRQFDRQKAAPTLVGTLQLTPVALGAIGTAVAGEEVVARVTLTVPNELEYVMIEVPKPAGCEPLNPLSGWDARLVRAEATGSARGTSLPHDAEGQSLYREERDDRSVFFLDHIEAGTWELRFGLRAVTPGNFRALPAQATAMYVPEVCANSDARRVRIERSSER